MSIQEPQRFTPAQVLDAGRRAEAEGRDEYALQFYRHLTDHYPGSPEATAAKGALARLAAHAPTTANGHRGPPSPSQGSVFGAPRLDGTPQALGNPFEPVRAGEPDFAQWQPAAPPPRHTPSHAAPASYEQAAPGELPAPARGYRTGRALARLITWAGGLEALAGLALLPIAVLNPRSIQALPLIGAWIAGPAFGLSLFMVGIFQVMLGQVVRAVLDQANAARDLAAVTRAQAEARQGGSGRARRR